MCMNRITTSLFALLFSLSLTSLGCDRQRAAEPQADTVIGDGERATQAETQPQSASANPSAVSLTTRTKPGLGTYIADGQGRSLYLFESDDGAEGSACYDVCAESWPPLILQDGQAQPAVGEGLDASMLATIQRRDGQVQVTYGGWPLYYWMEDAQPGDTTGQDIEDAGGEWYLVTPSGEKVHAEGEEHGHEGHE